MLSFSLLSLWDKKVPLPDGSVNFFLLLFRLPFQPCLFFTLFFGIAKHTAENREILRVHTPQNRHCLR